MVIPCGELSTCETWQDLLDMSKGRLFLTLSGGKIWHGDACAAVSTGASVSAGQFDYEEIEQQLKQLTDAWDFQK